MSKINRIFIANRGEIAVRIIRTARAMGIETVLGVSEADRDSLGAKLATRAVCIGPAPSSKSYLCVDTIVTAAKATNCDAVHPGYGFLSENRNLAETCAKNGLIFIGPSAENLDAVGDKLTARTHAKAANVPLVPGDTVENLEDAKALAGKIGYPVLIKAVAGGGGKGMKRVENDAMLDAQFDLAVAEALAAFGDGRVYVERYVDAGRHVEVQVISDGETILHAGERDCSVQRRFQKLVEEAPAPALPDHLRKGMHQAAVNFAKHIEYHSLGTVEFLYDVNRDCFYFLEMNARVQVEHPVTEEISRLDLIKEQIRIAEGVPLSYQQSDIALQGHAIELRINAEDIHNQFMPCPGRVSEVWFPSLRGVRVDTHMQTGAMIPPYYDSMICKVIAWGEDREEAIARLREALEVFELVGVTTNIPLHKLILNDETFIAGGVNTNYLPELLTKKDIS